MASTGVDRIRGVDPYTAIKAPCHVATTEHIKLSGSQTIDGVVVQETTPKTRVLVRAQQDPRENGIYDVHETAWVRSSDFNDPRDFVQATLVSVDSGNTYAQTTWRVNVTNPPVIGKSQITFTIIGNMGEGIPNEYDSVAAFVGSRPPTSTVRIKSYYGGWSDTVEGPKGGFTAHRTGYTADSPSVGNPVAPSTIGTGEQAGLFWTADGKEWRLSAEEIDIFMFGARGDGVSNDSPAIKATIRFVKGLGGGEAIVPAGVFLVHESIHVPANIRLIGRGSRVSGIRWGGDASGYTKGVVYSDAGTDASPEILFSTAIRGLTISGGGRVDTSLYLRGQQENCDYHDLVISGFLGQSTAGLEFGRIEATTHGATFGDLHVIPNATGSSGGTAIRLRDVHKCTFKNITTDKPNASAGGDGAYAVGIDVAGNSILNTFEAIHTEDCDVGIYNKTPLNTFIGIEGINTYGTGSVHFKNTADSYTLLSIRTRSGFASHIEDSVSGNVPAGLDTSTPYHLVSVLGDNTVVTSSRERGKTYYGQLNVIGAPFRTRGETGNGVSVLNAQVAIPVGQIRNLVVSFASPVAAGCAGKLEIFSTGDQRYFYEVSFALRLNGGGSVTFASISAPSGTDTTVLTVAQPEALSTPAAGKFRIPVINKSGTYAQVIEARLTINTETTTVQGIVFA